jgi:hypothetical protein
VGSATALSRQSAEVELGRVVELDELVGLHLAELSTSDRPDVTPLGLVERPDGSGPPLASRRPPDRPSWSVDRSAVDGVREVEQSPLEFGTREFGRSIFVLFFKERRWADGPKIGKLCLRARR